MAVTVAMSLLSAEVSEKVRNLDVMSKQSELFCVQLLFENNNEERPNDHITPTICILCMRAWDNEG